MPISSVGKITEFGVTLIEMLIVVAIVGMIAGLAFPAASSGLESIRLSSASDSVASFLNSALNRAERTEQVVEIAISLKENMLWLHSTEPGFERKLAMPDGITIEAILPQPPLESEPLRRFLVLPGGTPPRISVQIANRKGARRIVSVDPIIGVPKIERVINP